MSTPERLAAERGMFFILDTRQTCGNCAFWWADQSMGYVCDLDKAGIYTEEEARRHRKTDIAVPCEVARAKSVTHCRVDWLRQDYDFEANAGRR